MTLPEITSPVDLCLPSGALNPAAVGWSRRPVHRANLRTGNAVARAATWGRTRRYEACHLVTPEHVLVLIVASMNLTGLAQLWLLDRRTGEEVDCRAAAPLAHGLRMPSQAWQGPLRAQAGRLTITADPGPPGTWLRATSPRVRLEAAVSAPDGQETLGVVVPWSDRLFHYSAKVTALPVAGRLSVDGREHTFGETAPAWAAMDVGRGRWPYQVTWTWGSGAGVVESVVLGLQLGGRRTAGTGASENALFVDGRLHYVPEELAWSYDLEDRAAPWSVTGERVDVRLAPIHVRDSILGLGVVSNRIHEAFGRWSGSVVDDDGTRRSVDGLEGWAAEFSTHW